MVDKNNIVIAGHWRLESAKKMWYDATVVKVLNIDSKDASQLRLLHNKISERETEQDLVNTKIELDVIWYTDQLDWLNLSMKDLYPEFDAPAFNEDDYNEGEWKEKQIVVVCYFKNLWDAELCKQDLEWLWYTPTVKG